jgi:hypothetical protein
MKNCLQTAKLYIDSALKCQVLGSIYKNLPHKTCYRNNNMYVTHFIHYKEYVNLPTLKKDMVTAEQMYSGGIWFKILTNSHVLAMTSLNTSRQMQNVTPLNNTKLFLVKLFPDNFMCV